MTTKEGPTLPQDDHRLLVRWAAGCAEHVLPLFEAAAPGDDRPRRAIQAAQAWAAEPAPRARIVEAATAAADGADAAARQTLDPASRAAACAAARAAAAVKAPALARRAAAYAVTAPGHAARASLEDAGRQDAPDGNRDRSRVRAAILAERSWQRARVPAHLRTFVGRDRRVDTSPQGQGAPVGRSGG